MAAAAPTQNPAFADAVQRARQISAKIGGSEKIGQKRPMEDGPGGDYSADPAKRAAVADPFGAQLAAMKGIPGMGMGPVVSEEIRVPDKMVGLIIGRGGEQITRLQVESGAKIQMAPDSGGMSDRICTLTGSQDAINLGKSLIENIINSKVQSNGSMPMGGGGGGMMGALSGKLGLGAGGGGGLGGPSIEIMIPSSKVGLVIGKGGETIRNLSDKHGVKMLIVQESATQEGDKPLRIVGDPMRCEQAKDEVMNILDSAPGFDRPGGGGGMGRGRGPPGGGFGDYGSPPGGPLPNQMDIPVPQPAVGVIIGKGGEMIRKIQADTGARLQFQQGKTMSPGEQVLTLSGKLDEVQEARRMVIDLIESVMARDESMGRGRGGGGGPGRGRGRGFGPPGGPWNGPGDSWGPGDGPGGGGGGGGGGMTEILYAVPANKCGLVIGKGGENIKQINAQSGAHCELDKRPQQSPNEKLFYIRGMPDQIEHAKQLINEKIGGPPGPMGGGPPGGGSYGQGMHGGSPPHSGYPPQGWNSSYPGWQGQSQGGGMSDNSNKSSDPNMWASYYASYYGAGQQPGQPAAQPSQGAAPQAAGGASQGGGQDFSQQWIDYYKQMGEHEKAAAIEQSLKARAATSGGPMQGGGGGASMQQAAPAAAGGGGADGGGKADYTAQWIAYYRANGMDKEADAIEQSLKTRQSGAAAGSPYGGSGAQSYYPTQTTAYPGYPSQ